MSWRVALAVWGVLTGAGPADSLEGRPAASRAPPAMESSAAASRARLQFGPARGRSVEVLDAMGRRVASVRLRPEAPVELSLPPGAYVLRASEGSTQALELQPGVVTRVDVQEPEAQEPEFQGPGGQGVQEPGAESDDAPPAPRPSPPVRAPETEPDRSRTTGDWRRWGAPLLSAVVPGLGQVVNGEPGKGVGIFAGATALGLGALFAWRAEDEGAGAGLDASDRSAGAEIARLWAVAGLSTGWALLWAGQIMDAYRVAVDADVTPRPDHRLNLQLARFSIVGASPGEPSHALYDQLSVALMGQVLPGLSIGVGDLGFRVSRGLRQASIQAGPRLAYRFLEWRTLWCGAAAGFVFQGTTMTTSRPTVDPEGDDERTRRRFGSSVYGQLDVRWFLLDRWSLDLMPRVSWSLTARDFGPGRQVPRHATTFEMGAGIGVYF